jgi:hypothetical protein
LARELEKPAELAASSDCCRKERRECMAGDHKSAARWPVQAFSKNLYKKKNNKNWFLNNQTSYFKS